MNSRATLPVADAPALRCARRRAKLLSAATSLGLAAVLAFCASTALLQSGAAGAPGRRRPTIAVLDVSASVGSAASRRIGQLLTSIAADGSGGVGLVLFSNTGYVALPPRSSASEARAYSRYFQAAPPARPAAGLSSSRPGQPFVPTSSQPWGVGFSSGTAISSGLAAAREALRRARIDAANIVVASDFADDMTDSPQLRRELERLTSMPAISLATAPLRPTSNAGLAEFRRLAKGKAPLYRRHPMHRTARGHTASGAASMSPWLLVAACLGLLAVAADWLLNSSLSWSDG